MTRHRTVHHKATTHKVHKAHKPKKPKKVPHAHQLTRSHRVRRVHAHVSAPKAQSNPYKVIVV